MLCAGDVRLMRTDQERNPKSIIRHHWLRQFEVRNVNQSGSGCPCDLVKVEVAEIARDAWDCGSRTVGKTCIEKRFGVLAKLGSGLP